jgi:hypothetical protein
MACVAEHVEPVAVLVFIDVAAGVALGERSLGIVERARR